VANQRTEIERLTVAWALEQKMVSDMCKDSAAGALAQRLNVANAEIERLTFDLAESDAILAMTRDSYRRMVARARRLRRERDIELERATHYREQWQVLAQEARGDD
jgi:hypothetical protein